MHFFVVQSGAFDVLVRNEGSAENFIGVSDEVQSVLQRQRAGADQVIVAEKGPNSIPST